MEITQLPATCCCCQIAYHHRFTKIKSSINFSSAAFMLGTSPVQMNGHNNWINRVIVVQSVLDPVTCSSFAVYHNVHHFMHFHTVYIRIHCYFSLLTMLWLAWKDSIRAIIGGPYYRQAGKGSFMHFQPIRLILLKSRSSALLQKQILCMFRSNMSEAINNNKDHFLCSIMLIE